MLAQFTHLDGTPHTSRPARTFDGCYSPVESEEVGKDEAGVPDIARHGTSWFGDTPGGSGAVPGHREVRKLSRPPRAE